MAKKAAKETSVPLIIALVFFVLATIGLGVFCYTMIQEQETVAAQKKKSEDDNKALRASAIQEELVSKIYKVYIGIDEPDDRTKLSETVEEGSKAALALKQLNEAVAKEEAANPEKLPKEYSFGFWPGDFADKKLKMPAGGGLLKITQKALAERDKTAKVVDQPKKDYEAAQKDMAARSVALANEQQAFKKVADELPGKNKTNNDQLRKLADDNNARFEKTNKDLRDKANQLEQERDTVKRNLADIDSKLAEAQRQLAQQQIAKKKGLDTFQYDEPQGKVIRRLADDVVEIDIGSAARLRPGITFTVLPYDFPEKGRQSRMFDERVSDERGRYRSVPVFKEKAVIEVIDVLGPNSARARIVQGSEYSPIRDKVILGDLLYNSVWRKGVADHIALIGIFDINGDGTDDIDTVIKDMTKMGIPVDGYFDLRTRKWVGQVSEQTRYLVIGAFPSSPLNDPNREARTKLLDSLNQALDQAKQKGTVDASYRDFFPRMGYRITPNVPEDKINQAASRYLSAIQAPEAAPPK